MSSNYCSGPIHVIDANGVFDEDKNIPDGTPCKCGKTKHYNKYTLEQAKIKLGINS